MLLSRGFPYELAFIIFVLAILVLILNLVEHLFLRKKHLWQVFSSLVKQKLNANTPLYGFASRIKRFLSAIKNRLNRKRIFWTVNIITTVLIGYWGYDLFFAQLGVVYDSHPSESYWMDQTQPLEIKFDRAFRQDLLVPQIRPEIKGRWEYVHDGIPFLARTVIFYPEESILPGERVTIYLSHVNNLVNLPGREWDKELLINSAMVPEIKSVIPADKSTSMATTDPIIFELTSNDGDFVNWEVDIEPEVGFELVRNKDSKFEVNFTNPLAQNTTYKVLLSRINQAIDLLNNEVIIEEDPELVAELEFTTVKAPALAGAEPVGDKVKVDSNVSFTFDKPMDQDSVRRSIIIEPAVDYILTWVNPSQLIIDPQADLLKETVYTIKFMKGVKAADGGIFETDITHQFTTIGPVKVAAVNPTPGSTRAKVDTSIRIEFDQDVDKQSAQSSFSISPNVAGTFSWDGNTMVYKPSSKLAPQAKYSIRVDKGVKTVFGLDQREDFNSTFTTRPEVVTLNVPSVIQPYRFACNITAAKMALQYRGINLSVDSLHSQIAKQTTPYDSATNTWGNPNLGFVGDIRGTEKGYGVHWGPISTLISNYRPTTVKTGWNLTDLLKEVEAGNPVIIWAHNGYSGSGANTTWNLPGGGSVYTVKGMHSYVVRGFTGTPEKPTQIHLNDPGRGRWSVSTSYFNGIWGTFNRSAVIVN